MAVGIIALAGTVIAILIEAIVSDWMDICSIYICPIGALLAAIMFFWIYGKDDAILEIDTGSKRNWADISFRLESLYFAA